MRIAVIANNLRVAGGESVGRNVVATLPRVTPMHEYLFVVPEGLGYESFSGTDRVELLEARSSSALSSASEILHRIPRALRGFSPDLVWSLGNLPIRHPTGRQALLVQDAHLFYPRAHFEREVWRHRQRNRAISAYLRNSLRFVDLVFCQTQTAAARFRNRYGFSAVAVMPNAVSGIPASQGVESEPPPRLEGYTDRFKLFALTKYYAHKNLELIVDAYAAHGMDLLAGTVCFLTVDPSHHPRARDLLRRIAREVPEQVVNLGPLPQSVIAQYYRGVDALVHPSTLESFSASYLEAMAFGVPILASDLDFAHEICGGAAIYFSPQQPSDLARCVQKLRHDTVLGDRLAAEGRQRLASVSADWPTIIRGALDAMGVPHTDAEERSTSP